MPNNIEKLKDRLLFAAAELEAIKLRDGMKDNWLQQNHPDIYKAQQAALIESLEKHNGQIIDKFLTAER